MTGQVTGMDVVLALEQYQVARALAIFRKMLIQWHGTGIITSAPDNILNFLEMSDHRGKEAKKLLIKKGFHFKKGTSDAI